MTKRKQRDEFADANKAIVLVGSVLVHVEEGDWPDLEGWAPDTQADAAVASLGKPLSRWLCASGFEAFRAWFRAVEHTWFCQAECADDTGLHVCRDFLDLHERAIEDSKEAAQGLADLIEQRHEALVRAREAYGRVVASASTDEER